MQYLLLILLPLGMAGGCWVLRGQARLAAAFGALATLVDLALVALAQTDEPARLLGATFGLSGIEQPLLAATLVLAAASLLAFAVESPGDNAVPATLLMVGFVTAAVLLASPFAGALALFAAGLATIFVIADVPAGSPRLVRPELIAATLKYLLQLSLGSTLVLAGLGLSETAGAGSPVGRGLLLAGFALLIGLLPFGVAVGDLAEDTPPSALVIVAGLVQLGALLLLLSTLQAQPSLLGGTGRPVALGLAALTAIAAPLLAGGTPRRVIALLFCANAGQIMLSLVLGTAAGVRGALFGVAGHALALALVGIAAGLLERQPPVRGEDDAPLRSRPLAAVALLAGLLVLAGVPPWAGWPAKALLWQTAAQRGPATLALVAIAQLTLLVGVVRLARTLLTAAPRASLLSPAEPVLAKRSGDTEDGPALAMPPYAPLLVRAALLLLVALSLVTGLYPDPLSTPVETSLAGLNAIVTGEELP